MPDGAAFCPACGTALRAPVPAGRPPSSPAGGTEVAAELRAAVGARRELGPEMEDSLVESFVSRLDERIAARVDEQVARRVPRSGRGGGLHNLPEPALVVGGSMALAIPLMGAGGDFAAVPVMIGVVLINLFYFVFRRP